jgi:hypothetical protein
VSQEASPLKYEIAELSTLRESVESLVYESWTRDFRCSPQGRTLPRDAYYPWQRRRIQALLEGGALVLVAYDPDSPDRVYGWLCADRQGDAVRVHYAYTKLYARGFGIAHALLEMAVEVLADDGVGAFVYTHDAAKKRGGMTDTGPRRQVEGLGLAYRPLEALSGVRSVA